MQLIMPRRTCGSEPAERRGALARGAFSSAPIGWPPGRCASDMIHPEDQRRQEQQKGHPQREERIDRPARRSLLGILVDLVIGDDDHDPDEDAERRVLRLGGTASATASSGSRNIITTSTMRKWRLRLGSRSAVPGCRPP